MKQTCLFIFFFFAVLAAASAQGGNDTLFHKITTVSDSIKNIPIRLLPSDYYASQLGFFCKKELQVQKTLKFPVKFRLGSVPYCDAMEGKTPAYNILPR